MDDSDNARIADFGFATVTQNLDSVQSAHCQRGTPRWTAPEVLDEGPYSKEADVFSFAMVMIEVCHRLPTVRRTLAYYHSYRYRYSLVRSRSLGFQPTGLCLP